MSERLTNISATALLVYEEDELNRMERDSLTILGAAIGQQMDSLGRKLTRPEMLTLRRQLEMTHLHPAVVSLRRSLQTQPVEPESTS